MRNSSSYVKHLEPETLSRTFGRFALGDLDSALEKQTNTGQVYLFEQPAQFTTIAAELAERDKVSSHQLTSPAGPGYVETRGAHGPIWLINLNLDASPESEQPFGPARDLAGMVFGAISRTTGLSKVYVHTRFITDPQIIAGALVGLECGRYSFKSPNWQTEFMLEDSLSAEAIAAGSSQGTAINVARHLVNLPANYLNPETYEQMIRLLFDPFDTVTVNVIKGEDLAEQQFNLLSAVGQGALHGPRMIHIKYRPKATGGKEAGSEKPYAFVGKGITFDNGGVNIKSFAGMRHMKKDMGGSATVTGLAYWAARSQYGHACDFYLAVAENAINEASYRPGDIIAGKNGLEVEIHNTDAEGRLVMADTLTYAAEQQPEFIIDVATLTGAIKIALGTELAGLFSNRNPLAEQLTAAGEVSHDFAWPMPLHQRYKSLLDSNFADIANAASSKFGGAITAALFLEQFVDGTPWAHLDIMAWVDGAQGCMRETGGNGQAVAMLVQFLKQRLADA